VRPGKGVTHGNIKVPDERVDRLARIYDPRKTTYAEIDFMDVGNSGGRAAGAFPPRVVEVMRNADVLVHVVRVFENLALDSDADPQRDHQLFDDELVLLDLDILERRGQRWKKMHQKGPEVRVNQRCVEHLEAGQPLRALDLDEAALASLRGIQLLSLKPLITLYNLSEEAWEDPQQAPLRDWRSLRRHSVSMGICGSLEQELAELEPEDQVELLEGLGLQEPARHLFIRSAYRLLDLVSFLTCGSDECRAWPVRRDSKARRAAGRVHSDIERGFIRAEVFRLEDLESLGSEFAIKRAGKLRVEGRDYLVQDGDVISFRFNV